MYCSKCGFENPNTANYCMNCGKMLSLNIRRVAGANKPAPSAPPAQAVTPAKIIAPAQSTTRLIAAVCTGCGAAINVSPDKGMGVCPFCNTPYIINAAENGSGFGGNAKDSTQQEIATLLEKAKDLEQKGRYMQAAEYYTRILDIRIDEEEARQRIDSISNRVFYSEPLLSSELGFGGSVEVKYNRIDVISRKKSRVSFEYRLMSNFKKRFENLSFDYEGRQSRPFICPANKGVSEWIQILETAKSGKIMF